ncbi:hypothetical protein AYO40_03450 [Planctomycetaceae bacterium SCGC AG-212-D15]|nr:hypothetical protein AYO40_03450 [Planctomycetaceae bacterium SCGC AG-212-D15]
MPHTPSPWKWVEKNGWSGIETSDGEDLLLYAICSTDQHGWHGKVVTDNPADRALLIAAPDLLAACKAAYSLIGVQHAGPSLEVSNQLAAAIRKAEEPQ